MRQGAAGAAAAMGDAVVKTGETAVKKHWDDWFSACDRGFQPMLMPRDLVRIVAMYIWSAGELFMLSIREPLIQLHVRRSENLIIVSKEAENELNVLETRICNRFLVPNTNPTLPELVGAINNDIENSPVRTNMSDYFALDIALVHPTYLEFETIWKYYLLKSVIPLTPKYLHVYWKKDLDVSFTLYFFTLLHQTPLHIHDLP